MPTLPPESRGAGQEKLRRDLLRLQELPPAPRVLQEIWRVLGSEFSSAKTLAGIVERDPALTAKILRLANSAYFGPSKPVSDVRSACVLLGFEMIKGLAVGVTALDALTRRTGKSLDLHAFWRHAVGTAIAAEAVAARLGVAGGGSAFCAGILHDLGKLVLATLAPDRYGALPEAGPGGLREREHEEFGADHQTVGGWIGEEWGFPPDILDAIRLHHEPWRADGGSIWGALVHAADWVAQRNGCPSVPPGGEVPESPDPRVAECLGLSPDRLGRMAEELAGELDTVESFVELVRR